MSVPVHTFTCFNDILHWITQHSLSASQFVNVRNHESFMAARGLSAQGATSFSTLGITLTQQTLNPRTVAVMFNTSGSTPTTMFLLCCFDSVATDKLLYVQGSFQQTVPSAIGATTAASGAEGDGTSPTKAPTATPTKTIEFATLNALDRWVKDQCATPDLFQVYLDAVAAAAKSCKLDLFNKPFDLLGWRCMASVSEDHLRNGVEQKVHYVCIEPVKKPQHSSALLHNSVYIRLGLSVDGRVDMVECSTGQRLHY